MTRISQTATSYPARNPRETWLIHWAQQHNTPIIRGTQQTEVQPTKGIPDYYLPQHRCFIEEKKHINDKLKPHQLEKCLYLKHLNYNISIAIRNTGAIIPLTQYLTLVKYNHKTWNQIMTQKTILTNQNRRECIT